VSSVIQSLKESCNYSDSKKIAGQNYVFETVVQIFLSLIYLMFVIIEVKLRFLCHCSDTITEAEVKRCVDDYVGVLTECLTEKVFIRDYHSSYPIDQDLDAMSQVCPEMYP
jgi:activating signal cointegrator complex subunit 2